MTASSSAGLTGLRRGWLPGLVLGAAAAFALLVTGFIGLAIAVGALSVIAWKGPRKIALAGFLTGAGSTWTLLFGRVMLSCAAENATPGMGCGAGDIDLWVTGSATILLVGVVSTIVVLRRRRGPDRT